jgi:hypothetical protein
MTYRLRGGSTDKDRALLADERKRLIEPAIAAAGNEAPYAYRVQKVATLHDLAERLAAVHGQHDAVVRLRREGQFDAAEKALDDAKETVADMLERFYAAADQNAGLADRNETTSFIKLVMQNWLDAEAKAIAAKDKS